MFYKKVSNLKGISAHELGQKNGLFQTNLTENPRVFDPSKGDTKIRPSVSGIELEKGNKDRGELDHMLIVEGINRFPKATGKARTR